MNESPEEFLENFYWALVFAIHLLFTISGGDRMIVRCTYCERIVGGVHIKGQSTCHTDWCPVIKPGNMHEWQEAFQAGFDGGIPSDIPREFLSAYRAGIDLQSKDTESKWPRLTHEQRKKLLEIVLIYNKSRWSVQRSFLAFTRLDSFRKLPAQLRLDLIVIDTECRKLAEKRRRLSKYYV